MIINRTSKERNNILFVVFLALISVSSFSVIGGSSTQCDIAFLNEEILSSPTVDGVTISMVPSETMDMVVEYGRPGLVSAEKTESIRVRPNALGVVSLDNLQSDTSYEYRVWCKKPYQTRFQPRDVHDFTTLHEAEDTFSFAYVTDTHAYATWTAGPSCNPVPQVNKAYYKMAQTRDNILTHDVDFVVLGGDWAMLSCGGSCSYCPVNGQSPGMMSITSQSEADLRYQKTLDEEVLGPLFQEIPFVYVLGDHEGEGGYQEDTNVFATNARKKHLPNPYAVYGGEKDGRYYSFKTGPVQIIIIDVMAQTGADGNLPVTADDWTLGPAQLRWLEGTLKASDAQWKLIFAEHLVGGEKGPTTPTLWKGRGSIKATLDDTPSSAYKGEQAVVHELMKQYGAQIFFSGNDHVATIGEKLDENGLGENIWHILGGRAGGKNPWTANETYVDEMDFDGDGVAEYNTDVTGTQKEGFFKITVNGGESLLLEYIRTNINNPGINNVVLFNHTIVP